MNLPTDEKLNEGFLKAVADSFRAFIDANGSSRSTKKLKPLHGFIAETMAARLGPGYKVFSQGWGAGKEKNISGRYYDKRVDIVVGRGGRMVCGIAVKFVMQNYRQNSVNYFEGMLGETANIRSGKCPYFQIFVILDELPHYKSGSPKRILEWETFTAHNAEKYHRLSEDNVESFFHTPNKTLIYVVHVSPEARWTADVDTNTGYVKFYKGREITVGVSDGRYGPFDDAVILNDYGCFVDKVYHAILSQ